MRWQEDYHTDNTFERNPDECEWEEECPKCKKTVRMIAVSGSTQWDSYSFTMCPKCGHKE